MIYIKLTENISNHLYAQGGEEGGDEGVLEERCILVETGCAQTGHNRPV